MGGREHMIFCQQQAATWILSLCYKSPRIHLPHLKLPFKESGPNRFFLVSVVIMSCFEWNQLSAPIIIGFTKHLCPSKVATHEPNTATASEVVGHKICPMRALHVENPPVIGWIVLFLPTPQFICWSLNPLVSQNVTVFGDSPFKEVIKLNQGCQSGP